MLLSRFNQQAHVFNKLTETHAVTGVISEY